MTSKFKQRWWIAGAIWMVAIIMTFWNFSLIKQVGSIRENSDRLRREFAFQHRNADKLRQIQTLYASHFKSVASIKLGFESVRSSLTALAALLGLSDVKIESQMAQVTDMHLPFKIRMLSNYQQATGFISALLKYPYLSIKHSRIEMVNSIGKTEIELMVDFQFQIETQSSDAPRPLQAVAPVSSLGVMTP